MATIYRQYRPQRFAEVVGQPHVTKTLEQAIMKGRIAHAYLFQGPRGTGKTSTARILAKRLLCEKSKDAEACGQCAPCKATEAGKNIDILEIDAASNRGIDNIRSLRESTTLSASMGKYKIYIIDEVHMLSHDAFPALLKTLEEPTSHVIFILATTELHKVPPTILSRCQVYRFRRATPEEMRGRLTYILGQEKREADSDVLDFIINRSDGCYRDAESLLGQLLSLKAKTLTASLLTESLGLPSPKMVLNFLAALAARDGKTALEIVDSIYSQGFDVEQFIQESMRGARDLLVAKAKGDKNVAEFMQGSGASVALTAAVRALVQATADLAFVPQPFIALEIAVLSICTVPAASAPASAPQRSPVETTKIPSQPAISSGVALSSSKPVPTAAQTLNDAPAVAGVVSVDKVRAVWGELISTIKQKNPVASTFLRAVEPIEVNGNVIVVKVSYPLHLTFFEKPDQKTAVEGALSQLLSTPVALKCKMDQSLLNKMASASRPDAQVSGQDDSLYQSVKEVFGT